MRLGKISGAALLSLAISQTAMAETFSLYFNSDSDGVISYEECILKKNKPIYYDCGNDLGIKLVIYASPAGSCTNTPGPDAVILLAEHTVNTASDCKGVLSINSSTVVADECACDATRSLQICAATKYQAYNYDTLMTEWVEKETISQALSYDSKPPSTPTLSSVTPGDKSLHVEFSGPSDIAEWEFCIEAVSGEPDADGGNDGDSGDSGDDLSPDAGEADSFEDADTLDPEDSGADAAEGQEDGSSPAGEDQDAGDWDADISDASESSDADAAEDPQDSGEESPDASDADSDASSGAGEAPAAEADEEKTDSESEGDLSTSEAGTLTGECTAGNSPFEGMNCFKTVTISSASSSTSGKISGLENGVTYRVTMTGRDLAGNYSGMTESLEATPAEVQDFFGAYINAGGSEEGGYGCSAASRIPGIFSSFAASALALALIRRRRPTPPEAANDSGSGCPEQRGGHQ